MIWNNEAIREEIIALARVSASKDALRTAIQKRTGESITEDMLRKAWHRWEITHGIPPLNQVIGITTTSKKKDSKLVMPTGLLPKRELEVFSERTTTIPDVLIVDGDTHYPIQDPYVEAAKLKLAQDLKPNMWINIGDCWDFWGISRHDKEPERWFNGEASLQSELDSAKPYWKEVRKVTQGDVKLILGNHERRLYKFIGANLALFDLHAFEWTSMAELPKGVEVLKYGTHLKVGPMTFEHGDSIGGRFGVKNPADWFITNRGNRNVCFGHFHRNETKHRTIYDECGEPHSYVAISQGHGSDVKKQTYMTEPSWQHGFTVMHYYMDGTKVRFNAFPINVVGGKFYYNGKLYDGGSSHPWSPTPNKKGK
jgi:hypothetical protein